MRPSRATTYIDIHELVADSVRAVLQVLRHASVVEHVRSSPRTATRLWIEWRRTASAAGDVERDPEHAWLGAARLLPISSGAQASARPFERQSSRRWPNGPHVMRRAISEATRVRVRSNEFRTLAGEREGRRQPTDIFSRRNCRWRSFGQDVIYPR